MHFKNEFKAIKKPLYIKSTEICFMKKCFGISMEILNFAGSVNVSKRNAIDWPLRITIHDAAAFKREMVPFFQQDIEDHCIMQQGQYERCRFVPFSKRVWAVFCQLSLLNMSQS